MLPRIKAIIPVLNKLYRRYWQFSYLPGRSCICCLFFLFSRPRIRNNCVFCKKALIIGTKKRHPGWETERQGKNGVTKRAGVMKIVSPLFVCFAISDKKVRKKNYWLPICDHSICFSGRFSWGFEKINCLAKGAIKVLDVRYWVSGRFSNATGVFKQALFDTT